MYSLANEMIKMQKLRVLSKIFCFVGFEVLTTVSTKMTIFYFVLNFTLPWW